MRSTSMSIAAAALLVAATACSSEQQVARGRETAAVAATPITVAQAGEVMGMRREAQAFLDSARTELVADRASVAAYHLRNAAAFTRGQANDAIGPAKPALDASAEELETLAGKLSVGAEKSVKALDRAAARMHVAEAQLHCTRAFEALKAKDNGAVAAEIVMLTDHFERSTADADRVLDAKARKAVANARSLAEALTKGSAVPAVGLQSTLKTMDEQVHALMTELSGAQH